MYVELWDSLYSLETEGFPKRIQQTQKFIEEASTSQSVLRSFLSQ
jgi:hypothetical protein